ncbi:MAG TPA: protein kinase, partial [Longimicrobiales bacterium]|nr:protein kinase [Longimicrobiales bacterium]
MTDVIPRLNDALRRRYRIERELGEGGMATVYLAEDLKHDRKVAVKVLKPELAAVVGAERFLAEIKTTANLQHPHILPLFDSGEADDFLFYVMPYVEGESLREKLDRETQLRVEDALALTRKVADALDYAHGKGVVHRDIKPANILLSGRGEPLVADFGIALAVTQAGGGRITETGLSLGTPHYMSPEQATGDRDVGPRSDVYALGCVLYETLAGQPPFAAPTAQAVLVRILTEEARRVGEVRHTVPRHVSEVLARALEKLPADRFESAAEFRQALDQPDFAHVVAGAGGPAGASSGGTNDDATRGRRGPRRAAALLPWAVSAAAVALAVWAWSGTGSTATEGVSLRTTLDLGDLEIEDDDPFFEVVISPDGSGLAVVGVVDDETNAIFWRPADDLEFRRIPGTEGYPVSPSFSPDGNWLAYVDEVRDRIMGVSLLGGRPSTIMPEGPLNPNLLDWGPGGWIVFFADTEASGDDGLYRVPDTGGAVETLFSGTTWRPLWPQLLPDDSGVLFSDPLSGSVALYDFASDTVRTLVSRGHKARYLASGHLTYLDEGGGLWAVAFDRGRGEIVGDPKPVLQGIRADGVEGRYSVSGDGTLVYGTGPVTSGGGGLDELVIVGVDGTVTPLD